VGLTRVRQGLVVGVGLLAAAVMVVLGLWQMQVFRDQGAAGLEERAKQPPVALSNFTGTNTIGNAYGLQVSITGEYLPDEEVLVGTSFPLRVATAFRTSAGDVVVVVRGVIEAGGSAAGAPAGTVTQVGVLLPSDARSRDVPDAGLPASTLDSLRIEVLAQTWTGPLVQGYVTLSEADAVAQGLTPAVADLPEGEGKVRNQGYAMQWWAFAAFAVVMSVLIARSMGRRDAAARSVDGALTGR